MNARSLRLGLVVLAALSLTASAWAQDQDAYLQRYGIAIDGLRSAVGSVDGDPVTAREGVDRAFNALLTLTRDAAGANLVTAMERVFERARTAITNGSADDLAVQAAVLEGGFQRLLYEAALLAALDGELTLARERLTRVANDVGFAPSDRAAVADASQPASVLRFLIEAGTADVIGTRLAVARELVTANPGAAYRSLARGYGAFLLVQDSPRAANTLNEGFVAAAGALVADEPANVIAALEAVEADIVELGAAARERRASVPGGGAAVSEPSVLPSVDATDADTPEPSDAAAGPAEAAAGTPFTLMGDDDPETYTEAELTALLIARAEAERREQLDRLEAELAATGMPAATRAILAERLLDTGYPTLATVAATLDAKAARVVAAVHVGDDATAHAALADLTAEFGALLSPILRPRDALLETETFELLERLADVRPLRVQDAVVVAGQIAAAWDAAFGGDVAAVQRGARTTTVLWAGLTRDVIALVIGLLALIPLFLLNLAFGGGNRNWQSIGVALLLLLAPALFEGLVGLGGVLATFAGVDALLPLAAFSVTANAAAQTVWAATTLLAVVFAITGLIGISRQFGLLGGRRRRGAGAAAGATPSVTATRGTGGTAATVDWDEDL